MSQDLYLGRRRFLIGAAAMSASLMTVGPSAVFAQGQRSRFAVKVASNQAAENASLQQLMVDRGFARDLSLDIQVVEGRAVNDPMDAILRGDADICMISGFVGVLPAIEQGKELRLVGAAMLLPALAVYSKNDSIKRLDDLIGRTVGIGPLKGLLHILMLALLRKKGIDPSKIKFVNAGSNAQVLEAVKAGKVDAGLSGVAGMSGANAVRVLDDGRLWQELPEYTYQPSYASVRAIREKPEELARCLAAYTMLYRYLSMPNSKAAYLDARSRATKESSSAEGEAVWDFIQKYQPYAVEPRLAPQRVAYLQELNVALGMQSKVLPFDQIADMSLVSSAKKFLA